MISKLDAISIQECLFSYKLLIERTFPIDDFEDNMKTERLKLVDHLIDKCEEEITQWK